MTRVTYTLLVLSLLSVVILATCEDRTWDNIFDANSDVDPASWAPRNLTAKVVSDSTIRLSWQPGTTHQGIRYRIERKTAGAEYAPIDSTADTTYVDPVRANATYWYRVRASTPENLSAPSEEQRITLEESPGPRINVSATSHDFGEVTVGDSLEWTLEITNPGDTTVVVERMITHQERVFAVLTPDLPREIGPEDSLACTIRFVPLKDIAYTDTLTITSNDPECPIVSVPLTGKGISTPPEEMHILRGTVVGVQGGTINIKIATTDGYDYVSALVTTDTKYILVDSTNIQPNGEPTRTEIEFAAIKIGQVIKVTSDENIYGKRSFRVTKVELIFTSKHPLISVSTDRHNFGAISTDSTSTWDFIVTNVGNATLTMSDVSCDLPEFSVLSPSFPQEVNPHDSVVVTIQFTPSQGYSYEATMSIANNDPYESEAGISLQGAGIVPATFKWRFATGDAVRSSPAIGTYGTIYVGSDDGYFYAINPDGTEQWRFATERGVTWSSPTIDVTGTIYVGSHDGNFYAINPDGTEQWRFATGDAVRSSPAIGTDGTIYVGSYDGLYALDPDGTLKWWDRIESPGIHSSPSIGTDGTIYVGTKQWDNSPNATVYAINPDGSEKWQFTTGNDVYSSPAIGADGTIYVASDDRSLYALDPDGTLKWRFAAGGSVASSPAIGADGTIYVGSWDTYLYAINPNGSERWQFATGGRMNSSPTIGPDGTIYVGSYDGYLYAIEGETTLADSPWPMFHHDVRHTGRAGN